MFDAEWVLIDTETTGFAKLIAVVELAAQPVQEWRRLDICATPDQSPKARNSRAMTSKIKRAESF